MLNKKHAVVLLAVAVGLVIGLAAPDAVAFDACDDYGQQKCGSTPWYHATSNPQNCQCRIWCEGEPNEIYELEPCDV